MDVCPDYEELLKLLNAHEVKYLVVGAQAVIFYTEPRFTKDMDVWIPPELNDPEKIYHVLKEFGAPLQHISPKDFENKKMIFQIGVAPVRIDLMMNLEGVNILDAWKNRKKGRYGKTSIHFLGPSDLIKNKRKAGRPQDKFDLTKLLDREKRFQPKKSRRSKKS